MKRKKQSALQSVILKVPEIKELYDEFLKSGFTSEQSFLLVTSVLKHLLK